MNSPDKTTAITTDLAERAMGARRPHYSVNREYRETGSWQHRHDYSPVSHARVHVLSSLLAVSLVPVP
jgi:hypothetical protein